MKKNIFKKLLACGLSAIMVLGLTACGGSASTPTDTGSNQTESSADAPAAPASDEGNATPSDGGTIMWLSNISSGDGYEAYLAYGEYVCGQLGYNLKVVYGDPFNDPAGNLSAVQTAMTGDVVAIISMQDGGVQNIMEEYPNLYFVGFGSDMASVYGEGGASASVLTNEKFLGTLCDGFAHGEDLGHTYAQAVIDRGYKKVATIAFPSFAYPQLAVADTAFRAEIEEYNASASEGDRIEIVGDVKTLEFAPLDESWFMEGDNSKLDAIVGLCSGTQFIYPTMVSAKASGLCSADTKLLTGGFESGPDMIADIGGEGTIQYIHFAPSEGIAWPIVLIDNALYGTQYADFSADRIDSASYVIDSKEDIDNVMAKSLIGTGDASNAKISFEELKNVLTRYNPDATYAQLNELFHSDQILVDALK